MGSATVQRGICASGSMMCLFSHRWQSYVCRSSWNGQVDKLMFPEDHLNSWMANQLPLA